MATFIAEVSFRFESESIETGELSFVGSATPLRTLGSS